MYWVAQRSGRAVEPDQRRVGFPCDHVDDRPQVQRVGPVVHRARDAAEDRGQGGWEIWQPLGAEAPVARGKALVAQPGIGEGTEDIPLVVAEEVHAEAPRGRQHRMDACRPVDGDEH